jgi:hypothetical protein
VKSKVEKPARARAGETLLIKINDFRIMARKNIVEITTATATLSKNQSGSLVVLNRAAGIVVTLPNVGRGLNYDFVVAATPTGAIDIETSGGASMTGSILVGGTTSAEGDRLFQSIGALKVGMGASATGGNIGTRINVVCDEDGVWHVSGQSTAHDVPATPFV